MYLTRQTFATDDGINDDHPVVASNYLKKVKPRCSSFQNFCLCWNFFLTQTSNYPNPHPIVTAKGISQPYDKGPHINY